MDKDYVAVEFSGKNLQEVVIKMIDFVNSIKGVNIMPEGGKSDENKADSI